MIIYLFYFILCIYLLLVPVVGSYALLMDTPYWPRVRVSIFNKNNGYFLLYNFRFSSQKPTRESQCIFKRSASDVANAVFIDKFLSPLTSQPSSTYNIFLFLFCLRFSHLAKMSFQIPFLVLFCDLFGIFFLKSYDKSFLLQFL